MRHLLALATLSLLVHAPAQQITWIYNPANGHSYGAGPTTTSWSAGETLAVSLGGHLATIRNAAEQAWIEANFGSYLGTHGLWIGFNDIAVEGQWVWVSGESVTYTNWAPGNPSNVGTIVEDAAHLYGPIGGVDQWKWNDETEWFAGILRPLIELPPTSWIQSPLNGRYYALTSAMSWTQAEQFAQQLGGHLATVRSQAENTWLASTFANGQQSLWIGLNDVQTEGTFTWSSGEPVAYANWGAGEPTNGNGVEDWAHLSIPWGGPPYNSQWNDAPDVAFFNGFPCRGIVELATPPAPATFASFGSGCVGPNTLVPLLAGVPGEEPQIGTTARIRVSNLPPGVVSVPIFVLGESNTQDPGPPAYPLPFDLGIFGWPGCAQLVSDELISFAITTTGQADFTLAVPMNLALVGYTFHAQALVLYHPSGVAASNGVTGVVGY